MKTFYLLLSAILPLMAASQIGVPFPVNALSESQKFALPDKQYQFLAQDLTQETLKQMLLNKQLEKPLPNVELMEQKVAERHPEHERIVKIRESLTLNDEEALLELVLTYEYTSEGDSILIGKVIFEYNESSQGYSFYSYNLDLNTGKWLNSYRESYYPDEAGRDTLIISYDVSPDGEGWENSSKTQFAYDSNGNITKYFYYTWNLGEWSCAFKNETIYDEMDRIISVARLYSYFDEWDGYKYEYGYNQQGSEISFAMYYWENDKNTWGGSYKYERLFDSNGNLYGYINFTWDYNQNIWIPSSKQENYVFIRENVLEYFQTEHRWNQDNSCWVLWQEISQLAMFDEHEISVISKTLDESTGELMFSEKYVIKTDESDNLLFQKSYIWSQSNNKWELTSELNNVYDDQKRIIESLQFFMKDTCITGTLISTFDSIQVINFTPTDISPSMNFFSTDTLDFVEGDGSLYWKYDLEGIGRSCIEMSNIPDLTDAEGIFLHYKILVPSNAMLQVVLVEESGEKWNYENYDLLASTLNEWQQLQLLFEGLYWPYDSVDNSILDKNQVKKIIIQVIEGQGLYASGSFLVDKLSGYNLEKTDSWEVLTRNVKKYDAKGNVIADSIFVWNYNREKLVPSNYSEAKYNDFGRRLQYESYFFDYFRNCWMGSVKNISTYDERNFMTSSTDYNWDSDKDEWLPMYKTVLGYNSSGLEILHETYHYDWYQQELIGNHKRELSYNAKNKKTSEISFSWQYDQKEWMYQEKIEWNYNNQNELTKEIFYYWSVEELRWEIYHIFFEAKYETVYDSRGNTACNIIKHWNEERQQWEPASKSYYIYKLTTGIEYYQEPSLSQAFDIYPNPARDAVNLRMKAEAEAQVVIFDFTGKAVKSLTTNASSTIISLQDLSSGIYIIRVNTEGSTYSQKLIVQ